MVTLLSLGASATGERARRMRESPQYRDGTFHNSVDTRIVIPKSGAHPLRELLFGGQKRKPTAAIPVLRPDSSAPLPANGLRVTWYGHASVLVELDGRRVLFDPVWSKRCSPFVHLGPKRLHEPPVGLAELPEVDAIVISHDHYDHLDLATVRGLVGEQSAPFLVPLGIGAHLDRWRVPRSRIVEFDWNEGIDLAGLRLTLTAAQHFSGRTMRRNPTLWGSWVVAGPTRRVYYTGDSGYFGGYRDIGSEYGPFDASLIQIGAYAPNWPDIHMTPQDAVQAHQDLDGGLLIPVHWATFVLSFHAWAEPADQVWAQAKASGVKLAVPRPGEQVDVDSPPMVDGWWQAIA